MTYWCKHFKNNFKTLRGWAEGLRYLPVPSSTIFLFPRIQGGFLGNVVALHFLYLVGCFLTHLFFFQCTRVLSNLSLSISPRFLFTELTGDTR